MRFPIDELEFTKAVINGKDGDVSMEIAIRPFKLTLDDYSESIDTSIRLDSISIPILNR